MTSLVSGWRSRAPPTLGDAERRALHTEKNTCNYLEGQQTTMATADDIQAKIDAEDLAYATRRAELEQKRVEAEEAKLAEQEELEVKHAQQADLINHLVKGLPKNELKDLEPALGDWRRAQVENNVTRLKADLKAMNKVLDSACFMRILEAQINQRRG